MDLEHYCISAICNWDEAAVYALTKLKPALFTDRNQGLFKIATGLFRMHGTVDQGVFISQASGLGVDKHTASIIYHQALDISDNWKHNFEELSRVGTYRIIAHHEQEISAMRSRGENIAKISGMATKFASEWITGLEKKYYSGKEIDELSEEIGKPIMTGYPLYDSEIYQYGGNQTGQMKGVICREKHGKTRSECWECAQNLRMGHRVLYLALEATKKEITGNIKSVLQNEWTALREQLFVVDGIRNLEELAAAVTEAVLVDNVDKVVIDYIQLVQVPKTRNENERINEATEAFRELMIRLDFHCVVLSQARKEDPSQTVPKDFNGNPTLPKGYRFVPGLYEAYGSNALIKASSIILIGFRPNRYEELIQRNELGAKIIDPLGNHGSYHSFFMKTAATRYKPDYVHKWFQMVDSDQGLRLKDWVRNHEA